MKPLHECLREAEGLVGIPGMADGFSRWGQDIQQYAERVWPSIAERVVQNFATQLFVEIGWSSPIEQKLFLALQSRLIGQLLDYPDATRILSGKRSSAISEFLVSKGHRPIFAEGDVDFEIDIFLYLDCFLLDVNGRRTRAPFYAGIECDGHEFHERTPAQAEKDRAKDRDLVRRGLQIIRFTGTEITRDPDRCVEELARIADTHHRERRALLERQG